MRTICCFLRPLSLALAAAPALAQNVWYVDDDGTPPGTGSQSDPYTSIAYALAQATTVAGDTVQVATGLYLESVDYLGKAVHVKAGDGEQPVLDARGLPSGLPAVVMVGIAGQGGILEGFEVFGDGGLPTGIWWDPNRGESPGGAGVFVQDGDATVLDCQFQQCNPGTIGLGGAVFVRAGSVTLSGCSLLACQAATGGGLFAIDSSVTLESGLVDGATTSGGPGGALRAEGSDVVIDSCSLVGCEADAGGAVSVKGGSLSVAGTELTDCATFPHSGGALEALGASVVLDSCTFEGNVAHRYWGGAVVLGGSVCAVTSCTFRDNHSYQGGAIAASSSTLELHGCTLADNSCAGTCVVEPGFGGAVWCSDDSSATATRCVFTGNVAEGCGAIAPLGGALFGPFAVQSCTFVGNTAQNALGGDGGDVAGAAQVRDSIFRASVPRPFDDLVTATYSDVEGGWPGEGNIDADPLFVSVPDDLHLRHGSPCIDAGDPASALDGDGTRADMGAFPYVWTDVGTKYCSAFVNSTGLPAVLRAQGSSSVADNWLRLIATDVAYNQFGYYLMSTNQDFVPFFRGSSGVLCVGTPIVRFNLAPQGEVLFSGSTGVMEFHPDLTDLPQGIVFQPGESWNFQLWFRDVVGGTFTSNTSDGVAVTWE